MPRPAKTTSAATFVAFALLISLFTTLRAQQPPAAPAAPAAPAGQPAPAPPKPLVPVATNTVNANPDAFYGQGVTITAAVDRILSKSAFSVDQRRVGGVAAPPKPTDVLVLVPTLQSPVDLKSYVTVMGELVRFDPAEIAKKAKDYKIDLPPDVAANYMGRPALIATSVITEKFADLAKRLPPPLTAEEESYQKVMKQVAPAFAALRGGVEAMNVENTTKNAAVLKQAFTDTEVFWKAKKADATQWARDARLKVESIQAAAGIGNWNAAKESVGAVGQACTTCHGAYRERFDDGSFRIKK